MREALDVRESVSVAVEERLQDLEVEDEIETVVAD